MVPDYYYQCLVSPGQTDRELANRCIDPALENQNLRTACDGWPNGFASRLTSSRKLQKVLTCVDLRWVTKRCKTCVDLCTNLSSIKVNASQRKSSLVNAVGGQTKRRSKTCIDLRRLASPVDPGLKLLPNVELEAARVLPRS